MADTNIRRRAGNVHSGGYSAIFFEIATKFLNLTVTLRYAVAVRQVV